eukprot:5041426-Prymnesium_polylepis.1
MPTTTCSLRPTDLSATGRARRENPVAAWPRPAARRQGACDASYPYYVICDLVDEVRRQGACHG